MPKKEYRFPIKFVPNDGQGELNFGRLIPKCPFRLIACGSSGSGKSSIIFSMLLNDHFPYRAVFEDRIFVVSPTMDLDRRYEKIKKEFDLEEENFSKADDFEEFITEILETQKEYSEEVKPPTLLIIDDCIGYFNKSSKSKLITIFVSGRHYGINIFLTSQAYREVPKTCRLQVTNLLVFSTNKKEKQILYEEHSQSLDDKEWYRIFDYATQDDYSFLHINYDNKPGERFVKRFESILQL